MFSIRILLDRDIGAYSSATAAACSHSSFPAKTPPSSVCVLGRIVYASLPQTAFSPVDHIAARRRILSVAVVIHNEALISGRGGTAEGVKIRTLPRFQKMSFLDTLLQSGRSLSPKSDY